MVLSNPASLVDLAEMNKEQKVDTIEMKQQLATIVEMMRQRCLPTPPAPQRRPPTPPSSGVPSGGGDGEGNPNNHYDKE